ncbi:DNA helicase RecQ [Ectothiorhodospira mobilis]|uniref:DNA helicase RecQ n=1 Tax=Ectothiorhodospira mobilis TaxID=195064 RepID=UPI0019032229|nr:DNA helicase RecQ [Ectothiorhodospira mobilis]MBK1691665.1 DNA helicase RecQ [Ectothiorhodospira mobilis]
MQPPSADPLRILQDTFGYTSFRPPQDAVIETLMGGGDALVIMPTGGGKSLCYQIPAMALPGTGVVVSPLIALMQDQVAALRQAGVRAACLNSTLDLDEVRQVERDLLEGDLDLLYVAPERLLAERTLELLSRARINLFAIDEAHCVSQWGHDFRPEYIRLSLLARHWPRVPRIALTATADARTRDEIRERLGLEGARAFISGFDRPNIRYRIHQGRGNARQALLRFIRETHPGEAGIVYCLSRKRVEEVATWLQEAGLDALPYHAGLGSQVREAHQRRFLNEEGVIIVATIAFGMGIDKPNVRFVAHLNLPRSIEAYYQETGRAGRDGLPADAWMRYGLQDVITLRQMLDASEADDARKRLERHKLDAMLGLCETTACRRQALLAYFGETLEAPCGNCDNCLEPPETWDATVAAQKALSCVHRTGQRFGVNYLVDVLRGREDPRIKHFGHDGLSVFGIGADLAVEAWRGVFRQLIARGLLAVDVEGHGALRLDESCRPVLRGETQLLLRREVRAPAGRRTARRTAASALTDPADRDLFEALRDCRRRLAEAQGVPPYVVFHDVTLMEMARRRPSTLADLAEIPGVGERKLETFGGDFLAVIAGEG